ncbi:MAG: hypothetical protein SWX82_04250 [Cyanobacteriota bacterium]|nr:hypothetical protein [Cyanobacteriota bacterium]
MNIVKTVALLGILSGLLVAVSYWLIGGPTGATVGLILAAVMNLSSWFFSDKIALAAYNARPVNQAEAPGLYGMVEKLCDRARLPMPEVYIIPTAAANAFATGRDPRALAQALQRLDQNARQMPLNANPAFEPLLIMNGFSGKFMANLFSTHPSTETRIEKLLELEQKLLT